MGYVNLKPARVLNRDMAILFGAEATRPVAEKVEAKAKALAEGEALVRRQPHRHQHSRSRHAYRRDHERQGP